MSYRVFARKYRPHQFEDLVGQDHIVRTLTASLENDRVAHAHVFSGPRGIGKTTTARLLAMAVNCENPVGGVEPCNECISCEQIQEGQSVDVVEIDGASNNSVDRIRELRENARYAPASNDRKVYIIDEVHMLSRSAFNALLKILEEPPEHVLFIFATTEIEQVPETVLSRCQRYDFRLIPTSDIASSLKTICEKESIDADDEALYLIAKFAEGSLRDAQSILDQMISFAGGGDSRITEDLVSETWGVAPYDQLVQFLGSFRDEDATAVLDLLQEHLEAGKDLMTLISDLAEMIRNLLLLQEERDSEFLSDELPDETLPALNELAGDFRRTELTWLFDELLDLHQSLRQHSRFQRELAEVAFVRLSEGRPKYNLAEITDRLEKLENTGDGTPSNPKKKPNDSSLKKTDHTQEPETEDESSGTSSEEPGIQLRAINEDVWNELLENIPNPARAFVKNCSQVVREDDTLIFQFDANQEDLVSRLQQQKHKEQLEQALETVLGEDIKLSLIMDNSDPETVDQSSVESDNEPSEGEEFLRQSRELLESE